MTASNLASMLKQQQASILEQWLRRQRAEHADEEQLRSDSPRFLHLFAEALGREGSENLESPAWDETRQMLADFVRSRAERGYSPTATATFVLSLKQPVFDQLRSEIKDVDAFGNEAWAATRLIDALALYTTEVFQKSREGVIGRQQQELLELSTPVTRLWDGILAVPLIGTLDSARTQVVMESLLEEIVKTGASIAVMDITGVAAVDTLVAQHLLKTVSAAKLMGAECVISGIRPQIAQTIVHLGVDLGDVVTRATLADAFRYSLQRLGLDVVERAAGS